MRSRFLTCATIAICFCAGAAACDSAPVESLDASSDFESPVANTFQAYVEDLATGIGTAREPPYLALVVRPDRMPVFESTEDATAWRRSASLTTWPAGDPVPCDITGEANPRQFHVFFQPDAPLEARWYELVVDVPADDELELAYEQAYGAERHPARVTRRFFGGSLPLLRVAVDPDVAGVGTPVVLGATEALRRETESTDVLSLVELWSHDARVSCSTDAPNLDYGLGAAQLVFVCDPIDRDSPLTLRVHPGIVSISGEPLRDYEGRTDAEVTWVPSANEGRPSQEPSESVLAIGAD